MTTAVLNISKTYKDLRVKIDSVSLPKVNWKLFCICGLLVCSVLLVFYVWQVNSLTAGSYTINNYINEADKLSQENRQLELTFAERSFLGSAVNKISAMNFQKAQSTEYVKLNDNYFVTAINK